MTKTISYGPSQPSEKDIQWFVKNVGPRTHYLLHSIGGRGWQFDLNFPNWTLTVEDDKHLTHWILIK